MRRSPIALSLVATAFAAACSGGSTPNTTPAPATQPPAAQPAAGRGAGAPPAAGQPPAAGGQGQAGAGRGAGGQGAPAGGRGAGGRGGGRGGAPAVDSALYIRSTPATNPVIKAMWDEGMTAKSQVYTLAQTLMDSIGPRLTNSPRYQAGQDWLVKKYTEWGIPAKREQWGTWNVWNRGTTHLDLIAPRVVQLEGMMIAWSPGTGGRPIEGEVILYPTDTSAANVAAWMRNAAGKFVLTGAPAPSCRSQAQIAEFYMPSDSSALAAARTAMGRGYTMRAPRAPAGGGRGYNYQWPADAKVAGVFSSSGSNYPGVQTIFGNWQQKVPTVDLSCEDYNMLFRMAQANQHPRVRLNAEAEFRGELPVHNVIATIRGSEKPNEYIIFSAHYDSWDGATGATDNGTGTIVMLEAARILKKIYPNPKRTIIIGHWGGEEQGLLGSHAWVEDHMDIASKVHAGWNQDNGTGRVVSAGPGPFTKANEHLAKWLKEIPNEITHWIRLGGPGAMPTSGSTDSYSFQCASSPVFSLGALGFDYSGLTHHTNRDTFDKISINDVKNNATLVAMLTYMADQDPVTMDRTNAASTPENATPNLCQKVRRQTVQ